MCRIALCDLGLGESALIRDIGLPPEPREYLMRLGLLPGTKVTLCRRAPQRDPSVYSIDGLEIALRSETARYIAVSRLSKARKGVDSR